VLLRQERSLDVVARVQDILSPSVAWAAAACLVVGCWHDVLLQQQQGPCYQHAMLSAALTAGVLAVMTACRSLAGQRQALCVDHNMPPLPGARGELSVHVQALGADCRPASCIGSQVLSAQCRSWWGFLQ
jgi:hypothetical protein